MLKSFSFQRKGSCQPVNLKELVSITAAAEHGTISRAAEKLYISQPALSRLIANVESELGTDLFKRTSEGLIPTVAGETYLRHAARIIREYKDLEAEVSHLNGMQTGRLLIGITPHLGSFALPSLLSVYARLFPQIEVSVVETESAPLEDLLARGAIDAALMHAPMVSEGIRCQKLIGERLLLAAPSGDETASHAKAQEGFDTPFLDLTLLKDRPFILTHPSQRTRQIAMRVLKNAGIDPPLIRYETKSIQTASRLASAGLGFTLVPHSYASLFSEGYRPVYFHIDERYQPFWDLVVAYPKEIPLSRPAQEFIGVAAETLPPLYRF